MLDHRLHLFTQDDTFMPEPIQTKPTFTQTAFYNPAVHSQHSHLHKPTDGPAKGNNIEIWAMKMEYWIRMLIIIFWRIVQKGIGPKRLGKSANGNTIVHPPFLLDEQLLYKGKIIRQIGGMEDRRSLKEDVLKQQFVFAEFSEVALRQMSFDDLYNKLRSLELDVRIGHSYGVKVAAAPTHSAFIGTACSGSKPTYSDQQRIVPSVSQTSGRSDNMDLKWQMAMLSLRINRFEKKAGRKMNYNNQQPARFDRRKVRCYKCLQLGHFARECNVKTVDDKARYSAFKVTETENTTGEVEKVYGMMAGLHADSADASDAAAEFAMMGISPKGDPSTDNDIGIVDSGCSRSMTGNKEKLDDFVQIKGGIVVLRIPRKHDLYTFHISDLQPEQKILHQNRSRIIDAIEDYAEELAKLQRQEYEAKDAAARYGYLFSQATAEILCQAEAEIRDQGVSAVKDPAGIDSAVKDPAGVDSNVKICGVDSVMVYLWQSFVIKPSAVSSSVSADFHPVYADESTLSGQQLGSSETIHDFPSPQIPCVEVELPVLPNDCDTIHPLVSASLGDSCVLCYVKKRAQKSTFGESAFIGYIQDQQRIQSYDQSIVDLLDFLSQSEATVLNQQYGWKTVHSCGANHAIGSKMDFEEQAGIARGIVVRNIKARLVHRDTTQEDGIDSMSWTLRVPFSMEKLKKKCMSLSLKDLKILTSQSMYTEWFIMLCRISSSTSAGMQDCLLFVKTYYEEFVHVPDINDSDYAGSHGDRKSLQVDVNFWAGRLISGSAKRDIVATSSTEAEYVAAASCSAQVLWIQNQLLDYGWSSVGVYYGSAGSYLYVDDGFCLVVLDSAGSYLFLLDAGSGLCCTMGSACYLFMLDSLFLLVDMALMLGEAIPLSPPMLAIAAAGDAADEPNAAANEAAGSTAEGIPCTSSPPPWPSVPVPRPPTPPAQTLRFEEPFSVWLDGKIRLIGNCVGNVSKKNNGGCTFDPCIPRRDVDIQDEVDLGRIITLWH
ncbi:ribonuclease H-like domain-containing protein [Tanacetum coccineum]